MDATRSNLAGRLRPLLVLLAGLVLVAGCSAAATPAARAPEAFEKPGGIGATDTAGQGGSGGGTPTGGGTASAAENSQQIVWTGRLQLQVADLDASLISARDAVRGLGGFVAASRRSAGEQPVASVTYRIPSAKWEDGLAALRKLAVKVVDEETKSSDVAAQIVDVAARLKNLRASETALQDIASKATRITDVLEVQAKLTEVRGQIESLAAQQANLSDQVSYGTLTVTFGTQVVAVKEAADRWDPAREVDAASASLIGFLQDVASALIWFVIVWLPAILFGAALLWLLFQVWRRVGYRLARLAPPPAPAPAGWGGAPPSGGQPPTGSGGERGD